MNLINLGRRLKTKLQRELIYQRFVYHIRPTDVFIVSYPKSGTTWLSTLLANYFRQESDEPVHLWNSIHYVPDVNRVFVKRKALWRIGFPELASLPDPRFMKVHATYSPVLKNVVYILRDPRDVMVSYWHHFRRVRADFQLPLSEFLRREELLRPCRWDEHVTDWLLRDRQTNLLLVRYENLHQDTASILRQVLEFANVLCDNSRIQDAVEASRFENMHQLEKQFQHLAAVKPQKGETFVRKGQQGNWREELNIEELELIELAYGQTMRAIGYQLSSPRVESFSDGQYLPHT